MMRTAIMRAGAITVACFVGACASTPASLVTVTPAMPRPVVANECWRESPEAPRMPDGDATTLAVVKHIESLKADRRRLVAWRAVCRASLAAQIGAPEKAATKSKSTRAPTS